MKHFFYGLFLTTFFIYGCSNEQPVVNESENIIESVQENQDLDTSSTNEITIVTNPEDFIPESFKLFEELKGDLNEDGREDVVLIIKGTNPTKVIEDEYRGELDRNRRGIIILINQDDGYEMVLRNDHCFSSENEDGGVYFPPELEPYIEDNKLYFHYGHGRYGHWKYTFRFQEGAFKLIGYDSYIHQGPTVLSEHSYNFLTRKKLTKTNTDPYSEDPDNPTFEEEWSDLPEWDLMLLSEIKDFDDLDFY